MPQHEAGIFHVGILDDGETWIDIYGREHAIAYLDQDYAENILNYLLKNAERFQALYLRKVDGISYEKQNLDPHRQSRATNWMLRTPCAIAIMHRILSFHYERP